MLAALASPRAAADVEVRLTTGSVLRGLRVERTADRVSVISASGTITVPASKVVSIRDVALAAPSPAERLNVAGAETAPAPAASLQRAPRILREGAAWTGLPDVAPLVRGGDLRAAEAGVRAARVADPSDVRLGIALGEILLAEARLTEAAAALRAVSVTGLPDPLRRARDLALAESLSRLQRVDEAADVLARTPDDAGGLVAEARALLQPDLALADRPAGSSPHFLLVAPPGSRAMQVDSLLSTLESIHAQLSSELGAAPRDRINVVLYPGTEFWEATGAGSEVGALFDGKMRVPAGRISPASPQLEAALRHEMTHAFVEAISGGRADVRWHEGLAEHFEGSDARPTVQALKAALRAGTGEWPPAVTHESSHARMEWFLGRWGMGGVRDVLAGLASRGTIDAALKPVTGLGDAGLDEAWRRDLIDDASRPRR